MRKTLGGELKKVQVDGRFEILRVQVEIQLHTRCNSGNNQTGKNKRYNFPTFLRPHDAIIKGSNEKLTKCEFKEL